MRTTIAIVLFALAALVGLWNLLTWRRHDWRQRGNLLCGSWAFVLLGAWLTGLLSYTL